MKKLALILFAVLALPSVSLAQSALAGTDLRLVPLTTPPSNLSGRAGIWNHSGVYTWHSAGDIDGPILQCPTCTTNVIPYFDTLSGDTAKASSFFFNSSTNSICDSGASGSFCVRLDGAFGVATIGYHNYQGDGNFVQNDNVGTKIYHNGAAFAQSVGTGASEKWQVHGLVHSTTGGIEFPDSTIQTTAASGGGGITGVFSIASQQVLQSNAGGYTTGTSGNFSNGAQFFFAVAATITGIKWVEPGGYTDNVKACLWWNSTVTPIECVTVTPPGTSSAALMSITFLTPHSINDGHNFLLSVWDGVHQILYGAVMQGVGGSPIADARFKPLGPNLFLMNSGYGNGGDDAPIHTDANNNYLGIEPVFTVP